MGFYSPAVLVKDEQRDGLRVKTDRRAGIGVAVFQFDSAATSNEGRTSSVALSRRLADELPTMMSKAA